tara:strand:- start:345 stop:1061 length:717 start_codon:yes stop_codon:yes gene_type:complete
MDIYDENYIKWQNWKYSNFGSLDNYQRKYFDKLINKIKSDKYKSFKVLEVGYGNGSFLSFAKYNKWEVHGVEVNNILLENARKKGYRIFSSIEEAINYKEKYDLIFAFDVLEHLNTNQLEELFISINILLKHNGSFIARFPNGDSPFSLSTQNGDITHLTSVGSGKIIYLSKKYNMNIDYIGGDVVPLINSSLLKVIHRLITLPIKFIIDFFVNILFYPGDNFRISFTAKNLLVILRK